MADHAEPVRTDPARDAQDGARANAGPLPATRLHAIAHQLNDAPKVASLKRDAARLNAARSGDAVQRAPQSRISATFTPPRAVVPAPPPAGIDADATIQRYQLRQIQENRDGISDLHYRYDDAIGGAAQPGEHLHITVQYQPAAAPAAAGAAAAAAPAIQTRHCYHNYNTGNWRWDNAPPAAVSAIANANQGPAVLWAAAHRPAPAAAAPAPVVPAAGFALQNDAQFPRLGR